VAVEVAGAGAEQQTQVAVQAALVVEVLDRRAKEYREMPEMVYQILAVVGVVLGEEQFQTAVTEAMEDQVL
jgi:hypothetical protein